MNFYEDFKQQNRPILMSAPLDGVSDFAFCKICLDGGADIVYTEMTSANDIYYESKILLEYLKLFKNTHKVGIQLYGKDPDKFTKAAQIAEELGFDEININFGCPAKGVTSSGGGVMHMRDLDNMYNIISNTIKGVSKIPVSIKIRAGILVESIKNHQLEIKESTLEFIENKSEITAADVVRRMSDLNISSLIIHGRTYEKLFSGDIDYDLIKKCKDISSKEYISKPLVIANGGIIDINTANITLDRACCDGLMIGRGSYGKPFIFNEIKGILNNNKKDFILNHAKYLFLSKPNKAHLDFRKHLLWYLKEEDDFTKLRERIVRIETINDIEEILKDI